MYCVIPGLIRYTDTVESVESGTPRDQDNVSDCTSGRKAKYSKGFGNKKTEEFKQDSQNPLRLPMSEGGEP
jgi:hypothetical protein